MNAETEQKLKNEIARLKERVRILQEALHAQTNEIETARGERRAKMIMEKECADLRRELQVEQRKRADAEAMIKRQADEIRTLQSRLRDAASYFGRLK